MRNSKINALREAKATRALLNDKRGWTLDIWENCGWHWCLRKGGMSLMQMGDTYWTLLSCDEDSGAGETFWSPRGGPSFTDPNNAVAYQLKLAQRFVEKCQKAINKVVA